MAKFTLEQKLNAVDDYLQGRGSYKSIGKKLGTGHVTIQKWVALYEAHGTEGLISKYTNYSTEFKMDVINYMIETGTSLIETAAIYRIPSPSTILKWRKQLEEQGMDALHSKKRGRPSMKKETKKSIPVEGSKEALLAENERLRMEIAYLKKLQALIQEKEKLQNKTKGK